MSREYKEKEKKGKEKAPLVLYRTSLHNTIYDVLRTRPGWRETDSDTDWDFNWADVGWIREFYDHIHMDDHMRVNHFRNHYELTRKDLLVKNIKRMKKQLERSDAHEEASKYGFLPMSFTLPTDYGLFVEAFKRHPGEKWIMKPIGKAQGRGIFLVTKLSQVADWKKDHKWKSDAPQKAESYIVQKYVDNPYLIGGKKFDFRIYVLVTSFSPLTVWLYRDGFARFSNTRYNTSRDQTDNLFMHLTNVAIQKTASHYNSSQGCKWGLRQLKLFMASKLGMPAVDGMFADVQAMIIRSLLAVQKVIIQDKHSFELYGYDVLIDNKLKPWLLEVNASPSLTADTDKDYELKRGLLEDTLAVIDIEGRLTGREVQVGGYDLIWQNGPIRLDYPPCVSTFLGCFNNRAKQLKVLKKSLAAGRKEGK